MPNYTLTLPTEDDIASIEAARSHGHALVDAAADAALQGLPPAVIPPAPPNPENPWYWWVWGKIQEAAAAFVAAATAP